MAVKMLSGAVLATMLLAPTADAQSLAQIGGPANPPPASFRGQQFVDSRGCLFLRAGYGAGVNWVARVDRNHKPICTMTPTGSAAAQAAVAADMAPDPQAVVQPQTNVAAAQAAVAAPTPGPKPTVVATTKAAKPATTRQTAPAYQGATVATSLAGVQCFDTAPVLERVNVSGGTALVCTRGDATTTGWRPPLITSAVQAQVAAQTAPLVTAPATTPSYGASVQVAAVPQPPVSRSHTLPKPPKGWVYSWKDDRLNPLRGIGTAAGQAQQDQVWQRTVPMVLVTDPKPQSAFARALGFKPVMATPPLRTTVSTMSSKPAAHQTAPKGSGAMLIQVGCFGDPANAQGVMARLSALGLPVSIAHITRNGKALQVIYAGPFGTGPEAASSLATVHSAGYADAFLR